MSGKRNIPLLKIFWGILLILSILMIALVLPRGTDKFLAAADHPEKASLLDLQVFGFDKSTAWSILNALGEDGRRQYAVFAMREDLVFPLAYGLFFGVSLFLLAGKRYRNRTQVLLILPLLAMLADFAENYSIVLLNRQFPKLMNSTVKSASFANIVKWGSVAVSLGLMVVLLILQILRGKTGKQR
jgi:hypothetical protein